MTNFYTTMSIESRSRGWRFLRWAVRVQWLPLIRLAGRYARTQYRIDKGPWQDVPIHVDVVMDVKTGEVPA